MVKSKEVVTDVAQKVEIVPNCSVYDTQEGNAVKIVTAREARNPRYKPV